MGSARGLQAASGGTVQLAVATATSRATGFVRTSVWAGALGLYSVGSAFTIANTLPTILFTLLAGGVLSAILVPQLVRAMGRGAEEGQAYADRLLTLTIVVLTPLTVGAILVAPGLARIYAGQGWSAADLSLAAVFTAWCLPQVLFCGLFAVLSQILHARDRPGPMAWAPVANNVVAIAVGVGFLRRGGVHTGPGAGASESVSGAEAAAIGGGATLGVVLQVLVLLPALRAAGFRYRPRWDLRGAGLGRTARLAGWTVVFVAANQVAFAVTAAAANTAGKAAELEAGWAAGLPSYTNAYMIMLVPHAVVAVSIAAVSMPAMSRSAAIGRPEEVGAAVGRQLLGAGRLLVPTAAATAAAGPLITRLLFPGNPPADTWYLGVVLSAFAPAVVLYSAQFLVVRGLQALEDTRTPALIQLVVAGVQAATAVAALVVLPSAWVVAGAAGGFSIAYAVGLALSAVALRRRTGGPSGRLLAARHLAWAVAAAPASGAAHLASEAVLGSRVAGLVLTAAALAAAAVAFVAVYVLAIRGLGRAVTA